MSSSGARQSMETPIKSRDDVYELPDTPTSLASSYNKDVIYTPSSPTFTRNKSTESRHSLHGDSLLDWTMESSPQPHNSSMLGDIKEIKSMIARNSKNVEHRQSAHSLHSAQSPSHETESDLIQKWLQDRNRWDTIQQSYEQKVADAQSKLNSKSLYFNKRIEAMLNQELQYQGQIESLKQQNESVESEQSQKYNTLHQQHQELTESNRALIATHDDAQRMMLESQQQIKSKDARISELENEQQTLRTENARIKENNTNLIKKMEALTAGMDSDLKLKTKGLNDELLSTSNELGESQQENERLKHLEMTSQSMVERLLKRLEQQIHSAEDAQQQLAVKEKQHEAEIQRLEAINEKLQKHLTINDVAKSPRKMNAKLKVNTKQSSPSSPCSTTSESSLFTLSSTVRNISKRSTPMKRSSVSQHALELELDAVKQENVALKESLSTFREMLDLEEDHSFNKEQHDEEWITRIKEMAKQTVLVEKLKSGIMERDGQLVDRQRTLTQYETIIGDQKETIHSLEDNINQQRQSLMVLEKSNSDISMQVVEERTMRQKLDSEIQDLEFENKQLRSKLIAFKHFASETTVHLQGPVRGEVVSKDHGNVDDVDSRSNDSNPQSGSMEAVQSESVGKLSDGNTAHTAQSAASNVMQSIHQDQELLDGLRGLLHRFSMQDSAESAPRPTSSAQNVLRRSSSKRSTATSSADIIHRTATSTDSMSMHREKKSSKRQRVSSLTPVSRLLHHNQSETRNAKKKRTVKRKRSHSMQQKPSLTPAVSSNCVRVQVTRRPRKVVRSKMNKAAKSGKIRSKGIKLRRNKSCKAASRQRVLNPCVHNKQWA